MKIKTLLLSTVAAAGLSSAALAADPAALTSLDVCDALGISGLTISSDENCLQISGGVKYEFGWGDYNGTAPGTIHAMSDNSETAPGVNQDWYSKVDAWLKFVGTADSDFGPAKAVIKLDFDEDSVWMDEVQVGTTSSVLRVEEAYVSVGDSTVLMAGKKGTIANRSNDTAYNWKGLRHDDDGDTTTLWDLNTTSLGGHVIQLTSDLGNGVDVAIGLEDLAGNGSLVGVLNYSGDSVAAHITFVADDVLSGVVSTWAIHTGVEVTVDTYKFLVAAAYDSTTTNYNVLASAQATFDMFTLAGSVGASQVGALNGLEFGGSISAAVTDTVTVMLSGRWDDDDTGTASTEIWNVDVGLVAAVTETITLSAAIGVEGDVGLATTTLYGGVKGAWAPGGGFTSSVEVKGNQNGSYVAKFKAAKSF